MEGDQVKAEILKYRKKIYEIDTFLEEDITKDSRLKTADQEIRLLKQIKSTVQFLSDQKRLKLSRIPHSSLPLEVLKKSESDKNTSVKTSVTDWKEKIDERSFGNRIVIIMVLCVVVILTVFSSWIEVNGMQISLTEVIDTLEAFSYWSSGDSVDSAITILWILCFAIWGVAILYGVALYQIYQTRKSSLFGWGIALMAGIIIFLILSGGEINSESGNWISVNVTLPGWIALIAGVGIYVIYNNPDYFSDLSSKTIPPNTQQGIKEEKTYAVTNYYPWQAIQILNVRLEKGQTNKIVLEYVKTSKDTRSLWKSANIYLHTDVLIAADLDEYTVRDVSFCIPRLNECGETEAVSIKDFPFSFARVKEIKVFIKNIEIVNGDFKECPYVHVDSGMNSKELTQYRNQTGRKEAVCRSEKMKEGWICECGLLHRLSESTCQRCGGKIAQ